MRVDLEFVRAELGRLSGGNEEFAAFSRRIMKTGKVILGVRTPDMRRLARSLARGVGFEDIERMLDGIDSQIYEEVLLVGMVVNYARLTDEERLALTGKYLVLADNWALIDMFAEKWRRKYDRNLWWDYSLSCLGDEGEFVVRYGVMNLMSNYLDEEYFERTLTAVRRVRHGGYYVRMGLAWLYATAAVRNYERVMAELAGGGVDGWVRKKAYQKMVESYQIGAGQKAEIRAVRDKIVVLKSKRNF